MEFSYDSYIIMASKYHLRSDYQSYLLHKEGLKFLNQLASTPKDTWKQNGEVVKKPLLQHEAKKVLDRLATGKYDSNFKKVFYLVK
tara:strand:+ start:1239 stop:1496 length:258 start_codon:yes stop_codon:yes gene_type:complete